jgi:hypothetical protein
MHILIAQALTIVKKPICPTFIHDDATRIVISIVGIIICYIIYCKCFKNLV